MNRKQKLAFPEGGQFRKGTAKKKIMKNGKQVETFGDDLNTCFRVVFNPGAESMKAAWDALYKTDQPEKIYAMVPFPSTSQAWDYGGEAYANGRLIARVDADHFITLRNPLTGEYEITNGEPYRAFKPGMKITYDRDGKHYELPIKCTGRLMLFLPVLGEMKFMVLKTTSYYDCLQISENLAAVQAVANAINGGNAAGIPLVIYRMQREILWNRPDGIGQRVKKWLVSIEPDHAFVDAAIKRMSKFALTGFQPTGFLTPGEPLEGANDPDQEEDEEEEESVDVPWEPTPDPEPASDVPIVDRSPASSETAGLQDPPATSPETATGSSTAETSEVDHKPTHTTGRMSYETAATVKDSQQVLYIDCPDALIEQKLKLMEKIPVKSRTDEIKWKIDAAKTILAHRKETGEHKK